jgi:hypothetical protein
MEVVSGMDSINDDSSVFDSATDSQNCDDSQSSQKKKRKRVQTAKPTSGRKSISDLFSLISDVKSQNDSLIRKFDSIDSRVTLVENSLLTIQTTSDNINCNLLKLKSDLNHQINNHELRLDSLNGEVQCLNNKISDLSNDKDKFYMEINKMNLIVSGLPDCISESNEQLTIALNRLLSDVVGRRIEIDCAFRLGLFSDLLPRRIKIRMHSLSDRILVWNHRGNAPKPIYINDDISQNMRQTHGKLRQQRREILAKTPGSDVWIDWKSLSIKYGVRPQLSTSNSSTASFTRTDHGSGHKSTSPRQTASFLGHH